ASSAALGVAIIGVAIMMWPQTAFKRLALACELWERPGMRVVVFGGAGDVGSRAVEDLTQSDDVELVTIADSNEDAAKALARRVGSGRNQVRVVPVDARVHDELVAAMKGHDVAASALGPFFMFEAPLVRAAIEAGVDYASVCDDWSAAEKVLDDFDEAAKVSGRTILTGLGASPGITNVGVRYFANRLDRVRRVDVSVYQPLNAGGGEAVFRHMLFIMSGEVAVWRDGRAMRVPACSEERTVEFPRFGPLKVWNMGHAEPVTVPRFFPDIEAVNFYMGYGKGSRLFVAPARLGLFANKAVTEATVKLIGRIERLAPDSAPAPGAVRLDVMGEKDGAEVHHMACGIGEMRATTGLSLSIGTQMLARGQTTSVGGGVFGPEACLDPEAFLASLQEKGIEAYEDLAMSRPLGATQSTHGAPTNNSRGASVRNP
ncbi:MAG: saccharopine dehydrogenase NADP-binding domain-containing protein, partial [Myxococcales bacterium]|nr:saccharopine dehydrogenase NADP-binding domain-containing protein [Myxococcales bacterium]